MLAETHGKLSSDSSQELERMEDLLTDYVFGSIKYLDRRYLHRVLTTAICDIEWDQSDVDTAAFAFWPQLPGGTEPDVMMTIGRDFPSAIRESAMKLAFPTSSQADSSSPIPWRRKRTG